MPEQMVKTAKKRKAKTKKNNQEDTEKFRKLLEKTRNSMPSIKR